MKSWEQSSSLARHVETYERQGNTSLSVTNAIWTEVTRRLPEAIYVINMHGSSTAAVKRWQVNEGSQSFDDSNRCLQDDSS